MYSDDDVKCAISMLTDNNPTFAIINNRARAILGRNHWAVDGEITGTEIDESTGEETVIRDKTRCKATDTEWWTAHAQALAELLDLMALQRG